MNGKNDVTVLGTRENVMIFFPLQSLQKDVLLKVTPALPSKHALLPVKHAFLSNTHYHDLTNSKYADLFISPPLNPNMYTFEAPVPAYPLDTVIPNYPLPLPQKAQDVGIHFTREKTASSELENLLTKAATPTGDLENMLKIPDSDFSSFLSLFAPSNTDPNEGAGDFAIPSTSAEIFDSFPFEIFQETPTAPQQPADTWREGEKWMEGQTEGGHQAYTLPGEPSPDPATFWMAPSSTASPSQLTPLLEAFPSLDHDISIPTHSYSPPSHSAHLHTLSSPPSHSTHLHTPSYSPPSLSTHLHTTSSPPSHTPSTSPSHGSTSLCAAGGGNRDALSFEEQLDFFDGVLDLDSMYPPTKKFQEGPPSQSEASSPVSHMHISPATTPLSTSPPSPAETKVDIKPSLPSPPLSPDPPSEKPKPSPLLFGKTEDEILLKVLVPRPGMSLKPVTRDKLISMPVEEFNHLLDLTGLNDIEVAFMKEWRRRGKNKTAAMVARKRKRDELTDLDAEVDQLRKQKAGLKSKYDQLRSDIVALKERTRAAEERVYQRFSQQSGLPVSRDSHIVHVDKSGKVLLGPRPSQQMLVVK